jgi:hypothetical protein
MATTAVSRKTFYLVYIYMHLPTAVVHAAVGTFEMHHASGFMHAIQLAVACSL